MDFLKRYFSRRRQQASEFESLRPLLSSSSETQRVRRWSDPDGIRGWLIASGIFVINFIILGQSRIAGVLYVDFMQFFHVSRESASAPYSLQQSVMMLFGPIVGILGQKFGITVIMVAGCVITAISSALCFFARNIKWITVSWGILYGIGAAFVSSVSLILIEQYFAKYRSSASGFVLSGTCFGALLFPILLNMLIDLFGVRGTFLLVGSIILNVIPIALLLREKEEPEGKLQDEENITPYAKYNSFSESEASFEDERKDMSALEGQETSAYSPKRVSFGGQKSEVGGKQSSGSLKVRAEVNIPSAESPKPSLLKSESDETTRENTTAAVGSNDEAEYVNGYSTEKALKSDPNGEASKVTSKKLRTSEEPLEILGIPFQSKGEFEVSATSQKGSSDNQKILFDSLLLEESKKDKSVTESSSRFTDKFVVKESGEKQLENVEDTSEKSGKRRRSIKTNIYEVTSEKRGEESTFVVSRSTESYENVINFNLLHSNADLVLDLLSNKIPIGDEEIAPMSNEVTQNYLETPDLEFISQELQRLEYHFRKPYNETQQYLTSIRSKLRKFQDQLTGDRSQLSKQKTLSLDGKELEYKDIRNVTIKKPNYTIEIVEYTCEIPIELYIPIKLQELYERSSAHIIAYYSNNERVYKVLRELRKLHEIFLSESHGFSKSKWKNDSLEKKTFSDIIKSNADVKLAKSNPNTFINHIMTSCRIQCNPMFLLVCLTRALFILTYIPVVTSVVDFAMDNGMTKSQGIYAIIALSAGELLGRLCTGWITDLRFISDVGFVVIALFLQGISSASLPHMKGIAMILPALVVFSALQGSLFVRHPILLMKYLKNREKFIGLGFLNFFPGIIGLLIPFYIGSIRDGLGSYAVMYYINGGFSGLIGILWLFEPQLRVYVPAITDPDDIFQSV